MKDMNWPERVAYLENQLADSDRDNKRLREFIEGLPDGDETPAQLAEAQRFRRSTMYWHERAMKAEARLAETLRSSIRGDIEAAYNGLDYLTSIHVATAADPNGGRQLAIDAAEIKGRLLQHMKRIDAVVTTSAEEPKS